MFELQSFRTYTHTTMSNEISLDRMALSAEISPESYVVTDKSLNGMHPPIVETFQCARKAFARYQALVLDQFAREKFYLDL